MTTRKDFFEEDEHGTGQEIVERVQLDRAHHGQCEDDKTSDRQDLSPRE